MTTWNTDRTFLENDIIIIFGSTIMVLSTSQVRLLNERLHQRLLGNTSLAINAWTQYALVKVACLNEILFRKCWSRHFISLSQRVVYQPIEHLKIHDAQLLTHWGRVTHICVSKLTIIGSDKWLVAWPAPSHYLNQYWNIVDWTLRSKLQWNFNRNPNIFFKEIAI